MPAKEQRHQVWMKWSLIGATSFLTASACQHGKKTAPAPSQPQPIQSPAAKTVVFPKLPTPYPGVLQLTQLGENSQARFSADGTRLIFVSRMRSSHKHAQVYEMLLPQMTERRLTFHDGDDLDPVISHDGTRFYYASGTDELKEETVATERLMRNYYPQGLKKSAGSRSPQVPELLSEIYLQTSNGREIERLTESPGYDGEVDVEPKSGKYIVFTSTRDGQHNVYLADSRGRSVRRISTSKLTDRGARFSPDGKTLIWYRLLPDGKASQLLLAEGNLRQPREILSGAGTMIHPSWHPNGTDIVFSSNRDGKFFNLYSIDREGKCLKRLTTIEMDQTQPQVSPDGQRIVFTGKKGESQHLFAIDYKSDGPCLNSQPATASASPTPPPGPKPSATPVSPPTSPSTSPAPSETSTPEPAAEATPEA